MVFSVNVNGHKDNFQRFSQRVLQMILIFVLQILLQN